MLSKSRELGVQFAREGVRVNALYPGPVKTPLLQELFAKDQERAARRPMHIPMSHFAEASEIAAAAAFLASDDSSFITGLTFLVDGRISAAYVSHRFRDHRHRPQRRCCSGEPSSRRRQGRRRTLIFHKRSVTLPGFMVTSTLHLRLLAAAQRSTYRCAAAILQGNEE